MSPDSGPSDRRERMASNTDARALRTRRRLISAYRELVGEGAVEPVSVAELIRRAGVTRSSFYAHFSGPSALAVAALTEIFDVVAALDSASRRDAVRDEREISEDSLREVLAFISDRRAAYADLLARTDEFTAAVEDAFAESALRTLTTQPQVTGDPVVTARFIAAGVMGAIGWWLRADTSLSSTDLARHLAAVIPDDFTRAPAGAGSSGSAPTFGAGPT